MLGGSHYCFFVFFAHNALLLLGIRSHALGDSSCKQQYERAGETIVLSPGPISETLYMAYWKFNKTKLVDIQGAIVYGRFSLDQNNYSLRIQDLRTTDSGDFTFISAGEKGQRPTSCTRLKVQEALKQPPILNVINKTETSEGSCEILIKCSSTPDQDVSYRWTGNDGMRNGSIQQYQLKPHEGDTNFTCTASNMVSEESASKSFNCQSLPSTPSPPTSSTSGDVNRFLIIAVVACIALVAIVGFVIVICRFKKAQAVVSEVNDELTVYAEIDDVISTNVMKPCSVYETLENKAPPVSPKPQAQTIYDKIQFSRMQQPQNT